MSVALAGTAPSTFEIKSAHLPLVALMLKSSNLELLAREMAQRFGDMPDFFDHDPVVIDLHPLNVAEANALPDFGALQALLREYRLVPMAVRGGTIEQTSLALAAGLTNAPDASIYRNAPAPVPFEPVASAPVAQAEPAPTPLPPPGALVIDKPLRSGQQVYARGRDLVVMAMVNPGAEVIADGHIHVYAPLRGKAIAGARGNGDARIFALSMAPELISIAGIYRTSEVPLPESVLGKTAQVRLVPGPEGDDKLVIDALGV
ncbi:septum site-determining protein MinC [Hydrogenophaga sp. BPS33]|uniref:septum site-determining protein MinC n=1 Tax=Hydrogenophaga sp. BPS33 TaxID=2651974 RepID=UPI00132013AA|nr:septum site-determining protein MinC [Hydrogenophaga sp. BPS33]QHE83556.1 septum site-determining protein MinC [Hydrogenophaga sp. BPS33]